jgi:hypothetical protein
MGDWLGTGTIASQLRKYRPFDEARAFVHALGLKGITEWLDYCKSGKKPADIPTDPRQTYRSSWAGYGDWLGTGRIPNQLRQYRPFKEARAFVHALGLKNGAEWREYSKSGKRPVYIPSAPHVVYAATGWAGLGDWLGTGTVANSLREFRSFEEARAFVHRLRLKSDAEWRAYCKSGNKPEDIPNSPGWVYAQTGWAGTRDWLGKNKARQEV